MVLCLWCKYVHRKADWIARHNTPGVGPWLPAGVAPQLQSQVLLQKSHYSVSLSLEAYIQKFFTLPRREHLTSDTARLVYRKRGAFLATDWYDDMDGEHAGELWEM